MRVTFLGQAGVLVTVDGENLLIDPYLSDNANVLTGGFWARGVPIPVDVRDYRGARAVVATHEHPDHLDALTVAPLLAVSPSTVLLAPAHAIPTLPWLVDDEQRIGMRGEGDTYEFGPFAVTSLPAAHSAEYTLERTQEFGHRWCSVVVEAGGKRLFHAGDTVDWDGFANEVGKVDVACVPINGRGREADGIVGNLDAREAANLCRRIRPKYAVPIHWDMFPVNPGDPEQFRAAMKGTGIEIVAGSAPLSFDVN